MTGGPPVARFFQRASVRVVTNIVPQTAPGVHVGRRYHGIQARLAVSFGVALVLILVDIELVGFFGLPLGGYEGRAGTFKQEAFQSLKLIADLKEERFSAIGPRSGRKT